MKALIYQGPGKYVWQEKSQPKIQQSTDVIVKVSSTTICGTDLHILKGDVPCPARSGLEGAYSGQWIRIRAAGRYRSWPRRRRILRYLFLEARKECKL
jgi:alcohol dehydrogenase